MYTHGGARGFEIKYRHNRSMCLTASRGKHQKLLSQSCHLRADQFWRWNRTLEIESTYYTRFCLDANPHSADVYLWDCDPVNKPHQRWTIKGL